MVRVNTNAVVSTLKNIPQDNFPVRSLFIYGKVVGEMARLLWDKSTGGDPGRHSLRRLIVRPRKESYFAHTDNGTDEYLEIECSRILH
jgi:hypothetical protein